MATFTDSEKVEYALKTTLNITMSKFGYAPFNETPAPPRVFPSNVMSKDLIKYGEGDLDENGAYVSGHSQSGNINTSLTTYESVLKYYKIVCPVTKKVSAAQLKDILGSTSLQTILGRQLFQINASYNFDGQASGGATDSNFWTKPIKYNFHTQSYFRGHYASQVDNDEKFNTANSNYKGLNLAWNHIAAGTDVSAAIDAEGNGTDVTKIVPHLKVFLQVQTEFQIGAANKENQCFGNTMMKDMVGLDFKVPVQVNVGEISGDPTVTAGTALNNITGPGVSSGNEWYTQSTAGTINFYAVGNTTTAVDNARNPIDNPTNSSAPMVTFLKYTGDHAGVSGLGGGGGGSGSGAATTVLQTTTEEPSWTDDSITIESIENSLGIGTASPGVPLHVEGRSYFAYNVSKLDGTLISWNSVNNQSTNMGADNTRCAIQGYGADAVASNYIRFYTWGSESMRITGDGNVGIGTQSPGDLLHIEDGELETRLRIKNTHGTTGSSVIRMQTANDLNSVIWQDDSTKFVVRASGGIPLYLGANSVNDHMVINTSGNVGIGTTSPKSGLHIINDNGLTISATQTTGSRTAILRLGTPYTINHDAYCAKITSTNNFSQDYNSDLRFFTSSGDTASSTEKMCILTNGNVGIGTTSPYSKLEITAGADTSHIRISEGSHNNSGDTFMYPALTYYARKDNIRRNYDPFNQQYGASASISFTDRPGTYTYVNAVRTSDIVFHTATNYVSPNLGHYPMERMRITAEGNVGIGTTSPDYKLDVNGSIRAGTGSISDVNYFGKVALGGVGPGGWAGFSHTNCQSSVSYALIQNSGGTTTLNCASGQTINFRQNDQLKMRIDSAGNVGIGTASPEQILHLSASDNDGTILRFSRTEYNEEDGWEIGQTAYGDYTAAGLDFIIKKLRSNTTGNVLIPDGNVGIGTASPGASLEIFKSVSGTGASAGIIFSRYRDTTSSPYRGSSIWHEYFDNGIDCMCFHSSKNANPYNQTPMMVIADTGNIGIGTTSPAKKLHIKSNDDMLRLEGSSNSYMTFAIGSTRKWFCGMGSSGWNKFYINSDSPYYDLLLNTSGGKVGIGTDSPAGLLDIKGADPNIFLHDTDSSSTTADVRLYFCESDANGNPNHCYRMRYNHRDLIFSEGDYGGSFSTVMSFHEVTAGGNLYVGIGTTTPAAKLEIKNGFQYITNNDGSYTRYGPNSSWSHYLFCGSGPRFAAANACVFNTNGNLHLDCANGFLLYLNHYSQNNVRTPNGLVYSSDDRLKHNEEIIDNALEIIKKIKAKKYFKSGKLYDEDYNYELDSSGNPITDDNYQIETGFIAQDVMKVPELKYLVYETDDDAYDMKEVFKKDSNGNFILDEKGEKIKEHVKNLAVRGRFGLRYNDIFVMNVQATQELDRQQQSYKAKISELENKVTTLESELSAIKQHLGI